MLPLFCSLFRRTGRILSVRPLPKEQKNSYKHQAPPPMVDGLLSPHYPLERGLPSFLWVAVFPVSFGWWCSSCPFGGGVLSHLFYNGEEVIIRLLLPWVVVVVVVVLSLLFFEQAALQASGLFLLLVVVLSRCRLFVQFFFLCKEWKKSDKHQAGSPMCDGVLAIVSDAWSRGISYLPWMVGFSPSTCWS